MMQLDLTDWQCIGIDLNYPAQLAVLFGPPAASPFRDITLHVRDARWRARVGGSNYEDGDPLAIAAARAAFVGHPVLTAVHQHRHDRLVVAFPGDLALEITGDPKRSIYGRAYSWVINAS